MVEAHSTDQLFLLQIDPKNAFNSIERSEILKETIDGFNAYMGTLLLFPSDNISFGVAMTPYKATFWEFYCFHSLYSLS